MTDKLKIPLQKLGDLIEGFIDPHGYLDWGPIDAFADSEGYERPPHAIPWKSQGGVEKPAAHWYTLQVGGPGEDEGVFYMCVASVFNNRFADAITIARYEFGEMTWSAFVPVLTQGEGEDAAITLDEDEIPEKMSAEDRRRLLGGLVGNLGKIQEEEAHLVKRAEEHAARMAELIGFN